MERLPEGCFDPRWCGSLLPAKVRRRWHAEVCVREEDRDTFEYLVLREWVWVWNKRMFERERERAQSGVLENEWEEGARLVCRFRSTFSWEEDPCCFPLWPWLTVWIHYAFSGALVQKSAVKPPAPPCRPINWAYIYYFDLSFAGEWHQSGSSTRCSGRRRRCHPHSVRGRLPACAGFVVREEERRSLGQRN